MKKQQEQKINPLLEAIAAIQSVTTNKSKNQQYELVDIMTFCNDPKYLNLPGNDFYLYLSQRVILKSFYMGTRGNEELKLDEEEWKWLYDNEDPEEQEGLVYERNGKQIIEKLQKKEKEGFNFRELCLVLGRRASKTVIASVISAYEVYKLLVIGNGNPQKFYKLPAGAEIAVINVALSQLQATILFGEIQLRLRDAPFFQGRIAKETTSEIRLYTDIDLKKKSDGSATGLSVPGSIMILCGHSNPDTLRGKSTILLLFDELAFYDESGKVTGNKFYSTLKPSLSHFYQFGEGRIVDISSPSSPNGVFYDIFKSAERYDDVLSFQMPTWCVNPGFDYNHPELRRDRESNPDGFAVEYGAQWARGGIYGNYFVEGLVDRSLNAGMLENLQPHLRPLPGYNYYLHVDPANGGARYIAVLVAKEIYTNHMGKRRVKVRLANVWLWEPEPGLGILFNKVDREIIDICGRFHPLAVTYDAWNSIQSLQLLKSHGINCIQTPFSNNYKQRIYLTLTEMMSYQPSPELLLYDVPLLIGELKHLKKKPIKRGLSIMPDRNSEVPTDDISDCLAGATAMASENVRMPLPAPVVVRMGYL